MKGFRKALVLSFTGTALLAAAVGLYYAIHSPLFVLQVVEVNDMPENAPVDSQVITNLAAVPTGMVNLFDLDLKPIEKRIMTNSWIKEVRLQKRFPQTLSIAVTFREPQAMMQTHDGTLAYVDDEGKAFGEVNLRLHADLPMVSGFSREPATRVQDALKLIKAWENSPAQKHAQISSVTWDQDRGFRVAALYTMKPETLTLPKAKKGQKKGASPAPAPKSFVRGRTMIDFGQEVDAQLDSQLVRLSDVLKYLSGHSIRAHQIWADAGKKIVVKTARGS